MRNVVVLAAAFLVRLVIAWRTPLIDHDGAFYMELAAALRAGNLELGLSTIWPPLYPALVALASFVTGYAPAHPDPLALERAARLVSVVAGTGVVAAVFALARRAAGERVAFAALILAAFHPRLLEYSAATLAESCFMLALLLALLLLAAPDGPSSSARTFGSGVAFGLAYLARPEGFLLAFSALLGSARTTRGLQRLGFLAALLLTVAPFIFWMRAETGHLTFGEKGGYNLWRSFRTQYEAVDPGFAGTASRFAESRELEDRTPRVPVRAFSLFAAAPGAVAGDSLRRLLRLVFETLPLATHWPWFLLAILGWPALRLPALRPAVAVLVTMPFIYAPFSVDRRFLVPAVPLLLIPAAFFLETWRRQGNWRASVSLALLAGLSASGMLYALAKASTDDAPEHRAAGAWLAAWSKEQGIARPTVMSRKTWVAFYSGGRIAELPDGDLDFVRARIAEKEADVVIVDERWAVPNRKALAPLLDPGKAPPDFVPVHVITTPKKLVVYDVRGIVRSIRR